MILIFCCHLQLSKRHYSRSRSPARSNLSPSDRCAQVWVFAWILVLSRLFPTRTEVALVHFTFVANAYIPLTRLQLLPRLVNLGLASQVDRAKSNDFDAASCC